MSPYQNISEQTLVYIYSEWICKASFHSRNMGFWSFLWTKLMEIVRRWHQQLICIFVSTVQEMFLSKLRKILNFIYIYSLFLSDLHQFALFCSSLFYSFYWIKSINFKPGLDLSFNRWRRGITMIMYESFARVWGELYTLGSPAKTDAKFYPSLELIYFRHNIDVLYAYPLWTTWTLFSVLFWLKETPSQTYLKVQTKDTLFLLFRGPECNIIKL